MVDFELGGRSFSGLRVVAQINKPITIIVAVARTVFCHDISAQGVVRAHLSEITHLDRNVSCSWKASFCPTSKSDQNFAVKVLTTTNSQVKKACLAVGIRNNLILGLRLLPFVSLEAHCAYGREVLWRIPPYYFAQTQNVQFLYSWNSRSSWRRSAF